MSNAKRPPVVLVARCFVKRNDGLLLLLKRSSADRRNPNKWEVPGGKAEHGQNIAEAQAAEVMQETGLVVQTTQPLVFPWSHLIKKGPYHGSIYLALFSVTEVVSGRLSLSEEHSDCVWVSYCEMLTYDLTYEVRVAADVLRSYLVNG